MIQEPATTEPAGGLPLLWPKLFGRALVVDSDPTWLQIMRRWLAAYGVSSIATASDIASANSALVGDEDVVITEVTVARESCFGFIARAVERVEAPTILAMSDRAPRAHVFRLKDFGVHAYLEKPFDAATLYRCLERLSSQGSYGTRNSTNERQVLLREPDAGAVNASMEAVVTAQRKRYSLTNAEAEVLRCILRGLRRVDIARERCISVNTVKTQVRSLLWKSGAANVRELVRRATHELRTRP